MVDFVLLIYCFVIIVPRIFFILEFFPSIPITDKKRWTDNDRNMSHFFMKSYTDFATHGLVMIIVKHYSSAVLSG